MKKLLQTYNLTKKYGDIYAVNNVNITLNSGDIYGLIGKNGAGKTTLMRMLLGLVYPTYGSYTYFTNEKEADFRRKIGAIIETPTIYNSCTAYENLKRYSILFGSPNDDIPNLLKKVGLNDVKNKKAGTFSLGMKQRLGIAIALLGNPQFLILDEPINGLDPAGISEIRDLILELHKENITILVSSHLLDELSKIATKIAIIDNGKLIEETNLTNLYSLCKQKLHFYVNNIEKATSVLSRIVDAEDLIISNDHITLLSHTEQSGKLNKLLCENDILVNRLELQTETLEQYFLGKVEKNG